jgi:hypothetical protein
MKKTLTTLLWLVCCQTQADNGFNPYNRQFTYNQNNQVGSTNWYSSALGTGVAQAGVLLVGGLVNAMSRPDPVVVTQPPATQAVSYPGQPAAPVSNGGPDGSGSCSNQTLYDQKGSPVSVRVCR